MTENVNRLLSEFSQRELKVTLELQMLEIAWLEVQIRNSSSIYDFNRFVINHLLYHRYKGYWGSEYNLSHIFPDHWIIGIGFFEHCIHKYNEYIGITVQTCYPLHENQKPVFRSFYEYY